MSIPNVSTSSQTKYKDGLTKLIQYGTDLNLNLAALDYESFQNYENFADYNTTIDNAISGVYDPNFQSLNSENNEQQKASNIVREVLLRQQELMDLQNNDLNNQVSTLDNMQSQIFTKERLIEENDEFSLKSERDIRVLSGSLLITVILLLIVFSYYRGGLSERNFSLLFIFILFIFLFYLCYQYNVFYLQDSLTRLFTFKFLYDVSSEIKAKTEAGLFGGSGSAVTSSSEKEWIDKNCKCDSGSGNLSGDDMYSGNYSGTGYAIDIEGETQVGFFYNDGSSPSQLIVPENTEARAGEFKDKIEYVDQPIGYKSDGSYQQSDPVGGELVGPQVYTANL